MKTPPIQYSRLRYETTSPARDGKLRYWALEAARKRVWFRRWRKEFLFIFVLLFAFTPHPTHIKAQELKPTSPLYLKPVSHIQPVSAVSFAVPNTVAPVVPPPPPAPVPSVAAVGVTGCGDTIYKQFIYGHESGCRTNAINPIGACGLGQALPCSKMGCSLSDWACQDAFFTNYANSVYGGWPQAYAFWLSHSWW